MVKDPDMSSKGQPEDSDSSEGGHQGLNISLVLTVSFFSALAMGMIAVMLAGLWYRFCSRQKSRESVP